MRGKRHERRAALLLRVLREGDFPVRRRAHPIRVRDAGLSVPGLLVGHGAYSWGCVVSDLIFCALVAFCLALVWGTM